MALTNTDIAEILLSQCSLSEINISRTLCRVPRIAKLLAKSGDEDYFHEDFADNEEIARAFITNGAFIFDKISTRLQHKRDIILLMAQKGVIDYALLPKCFHNDREILKNIITNQPNDIKYFMYDVELTEIALQKAILHRNILHQIFTECTNRNTFLRLLGKMITNSNAFIPQQFANDIEIVKEVLRINCEYYVHLSQKLRETFDIIMIYVYNGGTRLDLLPKYFRDNEEVVAKMVGALWNNYVFASKRLQRKMKILRLMPCFPRPFELINYNLTKKMLNNREFVAKFASYIAHIPQKFLYDREFAKMAVQNYWYALRKLPHCFKDDYEIAQIAIHNCPRAYDLLSKRLKEEPSIIKYVMKRTFCAHFPKRLFNNRDNVMLAVTNGYELPRDVIEKYSNDREIMFKHILTTCYHICDHICDDLRTDHEFLLECVKNHLCDARTSAIQCILDNDKIMIELIKKDIDLIVTYECCARLQNNSDIIAYYHKIPFAISPWFSIHRAIACAKNDTLCKIML